MRKGPPSTIRATILALICQGCFTTRRVETSKALEKRLRLIELKLDHCMYQIEILNDELDLK